MGSIGTIKGNYLFLYEKIISLKNKPHLVRGCHESCFPQNIGKTMLVLVSWAGCSKLTTSLVNVSLKFQTLISEICQYFLLKKREKLLLLSFFQQKISVYLVIKS